MRTIIATGSLVVLQGQVSASGFSGSFTGTASLATSASFAQTASFALNAGSAFNGGTITNPLTVSPTPTSSIRIGISGSATSSLYRDGPNINLTDVSGGLAYQISGSTIPSVEETYHNFFGNQFHVRGWFRPITSIGSSRSEILIGGALDQNAWYIAANATNNLIIGYNYDASAGSIASDARITLSRNGGNGYQASYIYYTSFRHAFTGINISSIRWLISNGDEGLGSTNAGAFIPGASNTYDIGGPTGTVRHTYTNQLTSTNINVSGSSIGATWYTTTNTDQRIEFRTQVAAGQSTRLGLIGWQSGAFFIQGDQAPIGFRTAGVDRWLIRADGVLTGSQGISVTGTTGYYLDGVQILYRDATYTRIDTRDGAECLSLGGSGDRSNYYDNNSHIFRPFNSGHISWQIVSGSHNSRLASTNSRIVLQENTAGDVQIRLTDGTSIVDFYALAGLGLIGTQNNTAFILVQNAIERWRINTSGHFVAGTDNSYDIGGSGTRARNGFFGTTVIVGNDPGTAVSLRVSGSGFFAGNIGAGAVATPTHTGYFLAPAASDSNIFLAGMQGVTNGLTYTRTSGNFVLNLSTGSFVVGTDPGGSEILRVSGSLRVTAQGYTGRNASTSLTRDWNNGNNQRVTLATGGNTLVFNNPQTGGVYVLEVLQPSSGGAGTVTWPGTVVWAGGTAPTLTTTNNRKDVFVFYYNGTNYLGGTFGLNYADTA